MKTYNKFLETPFSEDKKWIQKATKNMRKDKPCTGEKFGSETCPPGSKRYNLAKTFKKMAKEEVKPPEPPSEEEDPSIKSKQKRQMQIKKMVLLKKLQAVRAGSGADIVASHTPEGEMVEARDEVAIANRKWLDKRQKKIEQKHKEGKPVKPMRDYGEVKEGKDKAFDYVVKQLQKKHGKDAVVTKDNPMKPPTAAQKKAAAAHRAKLAKQDHRDPTEKASDGRYSDRYSNRGSD